MKKLKKMWKAFHSHFKASEIVYLNNYQIEVLSIEECFNYLDSNSLSIGSGNLIVKRILRLILEKVNKNETCSS